VQHRRPRRNRSNGERGAERPLWAMRPRTPAGRVHLATLAVRLKRKTTGEQFLAPLLARKLPKITMRRDRVQIIRVPERQRTTTLGPRRHVPAHRKTIQKPAVRTYLGIIGLLAMFRGRPRLSRNSPRLSQNSRGGIGLLPRTQACPLLLRTGTRCLRHLRVGRSLLRLRKPAQKRRRAHRLGQLSRRRSAKVGRRNRLRRGKADLRNHGMRRAILLRRRTTRTKTTKIKSRRSRNFDSSAFVFA